VDKWLNQKAFYPVEKKALILPSFKKYPMQVSTENKDKLEAVLTVRIGEEDYREKVDKVLKDYRRKANIPGFRKGHVPLGLIRKQYGKSVLIDEINQLLQRAVFEHIQKEELDILGNPLPQAQDNIDWEKQSEFAFQYDLGLAPDFELKFSGRTKVPYYRIVAEESLIDRYVEDYRNRFGGMSPGEKVDEKSVLRAEFTAVDKKGQAKEPEWKKTATFSAQSLESKGLKQMEGLAKGDKLVLEWKKAFAKDFNLARLLGIQEAELKAMSPYFELEILDLTALEPAPLDQALFDKVFPPGTVNSAEEFRNRLKADAEKMFVPQSESRFYQDVRDTLLKRIKFDLPDDFLKRWMKSKDDQELSAEEVEEKYPEMKDDIRWQLIENRTIRESGIRPSEEEIKDYTLNLVRQQLAQYGQVPGDEEMAGIVQNVLSNQEEMERIRDQVYHQKLIGYFRETLKVDEKEMTLEQFRKKFS